MKAYAYFDQHGTLKEFIIDPSVRQGNSNVNEIMIYMEDDWNGYITGDSTVDTIEVQASLKIYTTQEPTPVSQFNTLIDDIFYVEKVPAMKDYDPKFFKYGKDYNFIKYTIPSEALAVSGNARVNIILFDTDEGVETLFFGIIPFSIEETTALPAVPINWSEYLYLLGIANSVNNKINKSGLTFISNMTWKDTNNKNALAYNVSSNEFHLVSKLSVEDLSIDGHNGEIGYPDDLKFDILGTKPLILGEDTAVINEVFTFKFNSNDDPQILIKKNGSYAPLILESSNFSIDANSMVYRSLKFREDANGCCILADGENLTLIGEKVSIKGLSSDIDIQANNDISLKAQLISIYSQTLPLELAGEEGIELNCRQADLTTTDIDNIIFVTAGDFTWNGKIVATENYVTGVLTPVANRVTTIESYIPSQTSASNQLADKAFVNSSIATNTANFLGTYNVVTDLGLTISATHAQVEAKLDDLNLDPTNNDYVFVSYPDSTDPTQYTKFERYKYNADDDEWGFEYELNNSSFTSAQWAAINSGITDVKVSAYDAHLANMSNPHGVTASQIGLGNVDNTSDATKKTNFTGSIASGNSGFVTGGDVYSALALKADITYVDNYALAMSVVNDAFTEITIEED